MLSLCMACTLGPLDKDGNGTILQSSVPALRALVFIGNQSHPVSPNDCHAD